MNRYPKAYVEYLQLFHGSRDYFECHEVLEEYWKIDLNSPFRNQWVGLIQIAVALYHQRRGNVRGAQKMMASAVTILKSARTDLLGIDHEKLIAMLEGRLSQFIAKSDAPYEDLQMPVSDPYLVEVVAKSSDISFDPAVVHKHTTRDRSDVIAARQAALKLKTNDRNR